jgi:hypothetical protein
MLITLYTFQGKTKGNIFFSDLNFSFRDVVADEWNLFSFKKESNIMTSMLLSCLRTGITSGSFAQSWTFLFWVQGIRPQHFYLFRSRK